MLYYREHQCHAHRELAGGSFGSTAYAQTSKNFAGKVALSPSFLVDLLAFGLYLICERKNKAT